MMLISNGIAYGKSSDQLLFIGRPLGLLLSTLYEVSTNISWYPYLLIASQSVALIVISKVLINRAERSQGARLIAIAIQLLTFQYFISLQFTQAAILTSAAGLIAMFFGSSNSIRGFGAFLVFLGSQWRYEGSLISGLTVLGVLLLLFLSNRRDHSQFFKKIGSMMLILFLSVLTNLLFWSSFSPFLSDQTRQYVEFNMARDQAMSFIAKANNQEFMEIMSRTQMKQLDLELLNQWYFADPNTYTLDSIKKINLSSSISTKVKQVGNEVQLFVSDFLLPSWKWISTTILLSGIGLVSLKGIRFLITSWLFCIFVLFTADILFQRIPFRVASPLLLMGSITILISLHSRREPTSVRAVYQIPITLMFLILASPFIPTSVLVNAGTPLAISRINQVTGLVKQPVIAFPDFYSQLLNFSPFSDLNSISPAWSNIVGIGSAVRSPDFTNFISSKDLDEQLLNNVALGNAFLGTNNATVGGLVTEYIERFCNAPIEWESVDVVGIWRISNPESCQPTQESRQ